MVRVKKFRWGNGLALATAAYRSLKRRQGSTTNTYKGRQSKRTKTGRGNPKGGNRTMTKSKNKKKQKIVNKGIGISNNYASLVYKKPKGWKTLIKAGNDSQYETLSPISISSGLAAGCSSTQVVNNMTNNYSSNVDFVAMLTQIYVGSASVPLAPAPGSFNQGQKIFLKQCETQIMLSNCEPANTIVKIYYLVANVTAPTFVQPASAWTSGLTSIEGSNVNLGTFPGNEPTTSKQFNINWKVFKKQTVELPGGATHRCIWNFKPNRIIDQEYFVSNAMVKGITCAILTVAHGTPVDDSATINAGNIGLTLVKLVGNFRKRYVSQIVSPFYRNLKQVNGLTLTGSMAAGHEYVINEESGLLADLGGGAAALVAPTVDVA